MTFETSLYWPPAVSALLGCLWLWLVSLALGSRLLRVANVSLASLTIHERGIVSLAIGAGVLQYFPYVLGAFDKLTPSNVGLCFATLTVVLGFDLFRVARALGREIVNLSTKLRLLSVANRVWLGLFAVIMTILLVRALTIGPFGSDDDGYHLSAPNRWLRAGSLRYLPSYTNTNASLGFEMLYVFGLAAGSPGVKLIHYSAGLFALLALWLAARRAGSGWAGTLAASLLLVATPVCNVPFLFCMGYVDFGACWMTMTGVLLWLAWRERGEPRLLVCMALCVGLAASFKTTALTAGIAWAPVIVWQARRRNVSWFNIVRYGALLGLVAFLPVCPWMLRSWLLTGNPVFPMLSSVIATRDWTPELARVFSRFFHYYSWGIASGAALSEAKRRLIVGTTAVLCLAFGALGVARLKDPALRYLIVFATLFIVIAVNMAGMVFRYWLPALMCLALVVTSELNYRQRPSALKRWLPVLVMAIALLVELVRPSVQRPFMADVRVASGVRSLDEEYEDQDVWKMWRFIAANTPADAQILVAAFYTSFGASNYGCFWLRRNCYTTDSHMQGYIRLNNWDSFMGSLATAGIEYVLISEKQSSPNRHGYSFEAMRNEYPFCRKAADDYGEKLAQFGTFQFYRIHAASPARVSTR